MFRKGDSAYTCLSRLQNFPSVGMGTPGRFFAIENTGALFSKNEHDHSCASKKKSKSRTQVFTLISLFACGTLSVLFQRWEINFIFPALLLLFSFAARKRAHEELQNFERDYPALLTTLAASVRTGLDPISALSESGRYFPKDSIMKVALSRFKNRIESGENEECVLQSFAEEIPHPDLEVFRLALILSRKEGSSLAPSLLRLARSVRQRQSFRRKIRANLALQKLSAWGIACCACFLVLFQFGTHKNAFELVLGSGFGLLCFVAGALLLIVGLFWMLFLTQVKV